ncbi:hypothetical protein AB7C87_23900 [Natrarchaeobius sp. A-rgal3]|uniref:hypothetical protein n=1 Tax=Natrarchaeobius versutus TaxID=1679078 RepID=UPI00350FFA41
MTDSANSTREKASQLIIFDIGMTLLLVFLVRGEDVSLTDIWLTTSCLGLGMVLAVSFKVLDVSSSKSANLLALGVVITVMWAILGVFGFVSMMYSSIGLLWGLTVGILGHSLFEHRVGQRDQPTDA